MKKKLTAVISIFTLLCALFTGCARLNSTPSVFMWEVRAKEGNGKLYLLGSIHVGNDDFYPLNDVIERAYNNSDVLAVECDISTMLQSPNLSELMEKMMYTDGTTLKDHISPELYTQTYTAMKKYGLNLELFETMKPFALSSTIQGFQLEEWGYASDSGIDMYFLKKAHKEGKKIIEIESLEYQYDLLSGFSDEIQELMLKTTLEDEQYGKEVIDELIAVWVSGDAAAMEALLNEEDDSLSDEEKVIYAEYNKALLDDRNMGMVQRAEEYLAEGQTTFFVVGSAHLVGETGLVKQLKDKGYRVIQK